MSGNSRSLSDAGSPTPWSLVCCFLLFRSYAQFPVPVLDYFSRNIIPRVLVCSESGCIDYDADG